jgi:hypothetical protein
MKITLLSHCGRQIACSLPYDGAKYVVADGRQCECSRSEPLHVVGGRYKVRDEYEARSTAHCARCHGDLGELHVQFDTLFGVSEDEAVLNGRPRVY